MIKNTNTAQGIFHTITKACEWTILPEVRGTELQLQLLQTHYPLSSFHMQRPIAECGGIKSRQPWMLVK